MDLHFVSAVVGLASAKKTGTLLAHLRTGRGDALTPPPNRLHVRIHFEDGWPVFAEEGATAEALGRLLVREGTLTEAQYALVLEKVALGSRNGRPVRFGEAAIAMGLLTLAQRDAALSSQVRNKVTRCLGWDRVEHTFEPVALPPSLDRHPTPLEPLLLGALRTAPRAEIDRLLGLPELGYPRITFAARDAARVFRLRTPEVNFVRLADGTRATTELLRAEVPDSVHAGPLLAALALTGHLEVLRAPASSPAMPSPGDADEVPTSRAVAHDDPSPQRARAPALTVAPSRALPRSVAAWGRAARERARAALARHRRTRDSLAEAQAPPSIRAPGSDAEARILAERAFIAGRRSLFDGDVAGARELFDRAVGLCPDAAEYRLYVAWLAHHGSTAVAGDGALAEAAAVALAESGETALAHYVLGAIALRQGELARARASFDLAYAFEPRAARYFRLVKLRRERRGGRALRSSRAKVRRAERAMPLGAPVADGAVHQGVPRPIVAPHHGRAAGAARAPEPGPAAPPPAPSSGRGAVIAANPIVVLGNYEAPPSSRDVGAGASAGASEPALADAGAGESAPAGAFGAGESASAGAFGAGGSASAGASASAAPVGPALPAPGEVWGSAAGGATIEPATVARGRSRAPWGAVAVLLAVLVTAGGAGAAFLWRSGGPAHAPLETTSALAPRPSATLPLGGASTDPSSRSASASASASAWAASASARAASASASAPSALVDPGAPRADAPSPSGEPSASAPAGRGACRLELPPSSAGRRVFVDGRVVGEGPGALVVPCGARTVQIGSKGTPRAMVLPCGGTARAE